MSSEFEAEVDKSYSIVWRSIESICILDPATYRNKKNV